MDANGTCLAGRWQNESFVSYFEGTVEVDIVSGNETACRKEMEHKSTVYF